MLPHLEPLKIKEILIILIVLIILIKKVLAVQVKNINNVVVKNKSLIKGFFNALKYSKCILDTVLDTLFLRINCMYTVSKRLFLRFSRN